MHYFLLYNTPMKIIFYAKTGCPWCTEVAQFLLDHEFNFETRNVTTSENYMEEMIQKSGQTKAPTLDIDGEILADVGREEAEKYFKEKGYIK